MLQGYVKATRFHLELQRAVKVGEWRFNVDAPPPPHHRDDYDPSVLT